MAIKDLGPTKSSLLEKDVHKSTDLVVKMRDRALLVLPSTSGTKAVPIVMQPWQELNTMVIREALAPCILGWSETYISLEDIFVLPYQPSLLLSGLSVFWTIVTLEKLFPHYTHQHGSTALSTVDSIHDQGSSLLFW